MNKTTNLTFHRDDIDGQINEDMQKAQETIVIYSGYITPRRVEVLGDIFKRKLQEDVKVRCVVRPPNKNWTTPIERALGAATTLERLGVSVDLRQGTHEKVVLIDTDLVWIGSLNPLSYSNSSRELMVRIKSEGVAKKVGEFLSVPPVKIADIDNPPNVPDCPLCNRPMVLRFNGHTNEPFFGCARFPRCKHTQPIGLGKGPLSIQQFGAE